MKHLKAVLAVSLAMLTLTEAAGADTIELFTFAAPPYQVVSETPGPYGDVQGQTVDTVLCAVAGTGQQVRIHSAPPKRAIQFLVNSLIDGYFAVDPSITLDQVAFRTNPVSLEKWQLISLADAKTPENPRMGAVMGSNEEAWLRNHGKNVFLTVRTPEQLIALLHRQRIDQVLMDQRLLSTLGNTEGLASQFLRYVPLHVYFSSGFVARNPEFIDQFNRQIPACMDGGFDLDEDETAQIRAIAYDLFKELDAAVPMAAAISQGSKTNSLAEILNLDAQWRALAPLQPSALARQIADQPASAALAQWQQNSQPLITEIMVTDSLGALVAMSQLTSDYWQGDEPKFQYHIGRAGAGIYVSPVRYDDSTSRFQVTVSMAIRSRDRWLPVGVVAIGLDVEAAMSGERSVHYLTGLSRH